MRNKIIEEIYNDKQYIDYCYKVCKGKDIYQDLFQYVVLYLMEMPKGKLEAIYERGEIRMYVARIIYINVNSKRSQFYKEYSSVESFDFLTNDNFFKHSREEQGDWIVCENGKRILMNESKLQHSDVDADNRIEKIESKIKEKILFYHQKNIYPASVKLLQIYAELGTYQAVAKATRIPYKTVRRHIQGITEEIKKSL